MAGYIEHDGLPMDSFMIISLLGDDGERVGDALVNLFFSVSVRMNSVNNTEV